MTLLFITTGLPLTACGGAGQPKTYKVGVVNLSPPLEVVLEGFKEGMTELGYTEGENITYVYEGAADTVDKLDGLAQNLVAADVDLILSITTPASMAAQRATASNSIPIVFVPVNDPVKAGLVASLRNPGGNITGVTYGLQEGRRFEWLIQVAPAVKQVYIPYNPEDQSAVTSLAAVSEVAQNLGVELITRQARTQEEVTASVKNIPEEADAIFLAADTLVVGQVAAFAEAAVQRKLPTSASAPDIVMNQGILTTYSFDIRASGKQAARLAGQIFRGIKPADLPVEVPEFISIVNLKTAESIGLDIPDTILRQADVIVR